jgi:dipeptidyl-peptidase-4
MTTPTSGHMTPPRYVRAMLPLAVLSLSCAPQAPSWPAADEAYIEQSAATLSFRLGQPGNVTLAPDGTVLFTRTPPRSFVADLYALAPGSAEPARLLEAEALLGGQQEQLSPEEKARRERMRKATRGISSFELSDDGRLLLVPLSDRLFVVDRASGERRELQTGEGFPYDPQLSPAGDQVAYVVEGDVYVLPTAPTGSPRRLTDRQGDRDLQYGVAEFVAQEEMDRRSGLFWSPDGSRLAVQRSDLSEVDTVWVSDPAKPDQSPTPFRYPRAGRPNAEVGLAIWPLDGGPETEVSWDHAQWPYLCRVTWQQGAPLTLVVMNRAQTELAVLAASEDGATTKLLTETDPAWLNLDSPELPAWLADGSGFLWSTERRGGWQLELRGADGALQRELTPVSLGMQEFAGFAREASVAYVVASADPTESHVYAVALPDGTPRALTEERGVHDVLEVADGGALAISSALPSGEARQQLYDAAGTPGAVLPSVAERPPWSPNLEWTKVQVEDREHHAVLVRPRAFEPDRRYPVLVHVYGGPTSRMVSAAGRSYRLDQWFADAGFVVVAIDGRGTPNRGRDWQRVVRGDLGSTAVEDQVAVLQALGARHPELDLDRTGIFGWSFGGYLSALAVELRPDVFRAGVAGAPVTDWALYDTFYTERYMGTPESNPDGYERSSAVAHAAGLSRPLLVLHGTSDDNVHFAHSLALSEAAFRAGRGELVTLMPVSATHMTPDPAVALALAQFELRFFRQHLAPVTTAQR